MNTIGFELGGNIIVILQINRVIKLIICRIRAIYYSCFFQIGRHCSFEKVRFRRSPVGLMPKRSVKIGDNVTIFNGTEICALAEYPVIIGSNVFINQGCIIHPNTMIGNEVLFGFRVLVIPDTHKIGPSNKRAGEVIYKPIVIEEGCWIGANSIILGGVTVGHGTIIAAGSLVNKNCEPNCIYGGNPAKLIKNLV